MLPFLQTTAIQHKFQLVFHDFWSVFATCSLSLDSSDSCIVKVVKLQGRILFVSVAIWDVQAIFYHTEKFYK